MRNQSAATFREPTGLGLLKTTGNVATRASVKEQTHRKRCDVSAPGNARARPPLLACVRRATWLAAPDSGMIAFWRAGP